LIVTGVQTCALPISALDLDVELPAGKTTHVEFVAKQSGDYRFMCSRWCFADPAKSTGHNYMEGKLIVRPKAGTTHTIEVTEFYEIGRASCRERGEIA